MATVVEMGLTRGFILDDPVAGVLDNETYTLGGLGYEDITSYMYQTTITRGKNRELDRYSAATLSVTLNNRARAFDPNYVGSPFYGHIVPRIPVRVTVDGEQQFQGIIDDWNFNYEPGGNSEAEIVASDEFTSLARQALTAGTATTQYSGERISAVLDMISVNWPTDRRNISTGESILGEDVFDGNALEYLQKVTTSEQGQLFVSRSGDLTFLDRLDATPASSSLITFADDGSGIPYNTVIVNYGTELLINTAQVSSEAGTATAQNDRSRTTYGVIEESIDTLVNSSDQLANIADYVVSKYSSPEYRFDGISMNLDTMSVAHRATVLGLELGDVIKVIFTPNDVGDPITQYGQIIRLDHDIQNDRHDMTIGLSALDWTFLVLDDTLFGTLGDNYLAF